MSKAVLISIRPKWCEKIASGEKTIEVRKSRPKLKTPFKCYIYCTAGRAGDDALWVLDAPSREKYSLTAVSAYLEKAEGASKGNCKVIGEFTCDRIYEIRKRGIPENFDYCYLSLNEWGNDDIEVEIKTISASCVSKEELNAYGAKSPVLYGWHISNLKIYDTPRELKEFFKPCILGEQPDCPVCELGISVLGWKDSLLYPKWKCTNCLTRAPQSWCYVEEI